MERRLALEVDHGPTTQLAMDDRIALGERMREATAQLLGAEASEIAITGNTTEGMNIVISGLGLRAGERVVTTSVEHSSGIVPAYYMRERREVDLRIVPVAAEDAHETIVERFVEALGGRARLVILSEISYSTGQLLPLGEIVAAAHAAGAVVVVDGAQTAGQLPIDVRASAVDYYAIPSHKWLCGPDGLGALYVRGDLIHDLEPSKVAGRAASSYDLDGNFEPERDLNHEVRAHHGLGRGAGGRAGGHGAAPGIRPAGGLGSRPRAHPLRGGAFRPHRRRDRHQQPPRAVAHWPLSASRSRARKRAASAPTSSSRRAWSAAPCASTTRCGSRCTPSTSRTTWTARPRSWNASWRRAFRPR